MAEGFVGGADGATEIEAAVVGLGVDLHGDCDELTAHGAAGGIGEARLAVLLHEVTAQSFGFGEGLFEGPTGLGVSALDDGVVAIEEGFLLADEVLGDVEAIGAEGVAVIEDDEGVVPVVGNVDAVRSAGEEADFGEACGRFEDVGGGGFLVCGAGVDGIGGREKTRGQKEPGAVRGSVLSQKRDHPCDSDDSTP
jgi:hypothetical protein